MTMTFDPAAHPRAGSGRFTTAQAAEVTDLELAPQPLDSFDLEPGRTVVVSEFEHGDFDLGDLTVGRDEDGFYATGGPTVYLGAGLLTVAKDANDYVDANFHRVQSFAAERYGAQVQVVDRLNLETVRFVVTARLGEADDTSTITTALRERTALRGLSSDLEDYDAGDGPSTFDRALLAHLGRAEMRSRNPRDGVAPAGALYTQEDLDHSVKAARGLIGSHKALTRPDQRSGFTIVSNEDAAARGARGMPATSTYLSSAWNPPTSENPPLLPWRPPSGVPIATVDLDGHVTMIEPSGL